ncbi:unnamed protein product [Paramecium pentaurelia]|uniref:Uncharacterized protein n=1 Tax=Paramecium pentaurelia TaxID=43138 RepID=A0A8S1TQV6_9CILI|nr:unnamed protein product [Paramecium pentaurelia]
MGFITSFLCYFIPGVGLASYYSFRLGPQLPIACRKMGDNALDWVMVLSKQFQKLIYQKILLNQMNLLN